MSGEITMIEIKISGMTCGHCAAHVEEELAELPGVSDIKIDLHPEATSRVTFQSAAELSDADIRAAISEAGDYQIEDIIR